MRYKLINMIIVLSMLVGSLFCVFVDCVDSGRFFTYLGLLVVIGLPFIFYKSKFMFSDRQLFVYYVFIFFADYFGCVCRFYDLIGWYDVFIHFCAGFLLAKMGMFVLDKFGYCSNYVFNVIFSLIMVMAVSGFWEIFEYSCDVFFNFDMQNSIVTGVRDTMEDMIVAVMGGILYLEILVFKIKD